jgi:Flp pilus assembly protein TadG
MTMRMSHTISRSLCRFRKEERGAALVEFALVLPIMLVFFGVTIEGARMMWSYQAASAGVRDASRYLAMVAPIDVCTSQNAVAGYTAELETIVATAISGGSIYPGGITINSVTPTCAQGTHTGLHFGLVQVSASVTIDFPFGGLFTLAGGGLPGFTATVTDQHRVFGT